MRQYLKEEYGEDITVLFLNGACGDVNAYDYKNSSDKYHLEMDIPPIGIGRMLADTVIEINKNIVILPDDQPIRTASAILTVNARIPTEAEVKEALRVKALLDACEETGRETQHIALSTLAHDYSKKTIDTEMLAVRIGPWAIVTVAGELYTEIGLRIKAVSPIEHTLISELTNGAEGYIAPDNTIGTTAYGGCYFAGRFGMGAADVLVEGAKKLLEQLV